MSALIITLILIGVAVVGGAIIAAIVLSSGDDASDAAEGAANIGGTATYDENCRFSGTPIAVLRDFATGSGTAGRTAGLLTDGTAGTGSFVASIRLLSGGLELSEAAYGADFTGDGFRDDIIPSPADGTAASRLRLGLYASAPPNLGEANANIVIGPNTEWDILGLTAGTAPADNSVQIFVNRARGCWGLRRA